MPASSFNDLAFSVGIEEAAVIAFRRRVGRSEHVKTMDRVRALDFKLVDGLGLVFDGDGRVVVPVEAFGVVIDCFAIQVFVSRDLHRGLNADATLDAMVRSNFFCAGGK